MLLPRTPSLRAQRSNPESRRGEDSGLLRCARNDDVGTTVYEHTGLVPRTAAQRYSIGALLSRGPCVSECDPLGPGSALQRSTRCSLSGTRAMRLAPRTGDSLPVYPSAIPA
nr:hypothetical protein BDOA9_0147160 [Bradyrhizobium sp. DOA9]